MVLYWSDRQFNTAGMSKTITVADIFHEYVRRGFYTTDLRERVSVCAKCVQFVCGSQDHAGNEDRREARSLHTSLIER